MKAIKPLLFTFFCLTPFLPVQADSLSSPLLVTPPDPECALQQDSADLSAALKHCVGLAELGYANAQYALGSYWYDDVLTGQDYGKALNWYSQASVQGHAQAQLRLGIMYAKGQGVAVNKPQAFIILKMAAVNGSDAAYDEADRLLSEMQPEEFELANQVLSRIFRKYLRAVQEDELEQLLMP